MDLAMDLSENVTQHEKETVTDDRLHPNDGHQTLSDRGGDLCWVDHPYGVQIIRPLL